MFDLHTIAAENPAFTDRLHVKRLSVANVVGAGAGDAVTAAVVFAGPMPDANYVVLFDAGQDVVCYASAKTTLGFTANINPRLAANTVAAGTLNILAIE